jgi:hypothetical protein
LAAEKVVKAGLRFNFPFPGHQIIQNYISYSVIHRAQTLSLKMGNKQGGDKGSAGAPTNGSAPPSMLFKEHLYINIYEPAKAQMVRGILTQVDDCCPYF